jgi:hypothetical protein
LSHAHSLNQSLMGCLDWQVLLQAWIVHVGLERDTFPPTWNPARLKTQLSAMMAQCHSTREVEDGAVLICAWLLPTLQSSQSRTKGAVSAFLPRTSMAYPTSFLPRCGEEASG